MTEIKLQLNDFDHILIDDIYNGGVSFRMFSRGMLGESRVFNDGVTQKMGISENRLDSVIQALQEIKVLIDNYKEKKNNETQY